ncbi:fimbrial protein [Klebsiella oxytoca]|uniref:fimbrial protein n=1 Tax=Klebsiella oxytoca TaxID=571 RepID=UPI00189BADE2|nr:fimbrial protein [Klebsiella oxytoca]
MKNTVKGLMFCFAGSMMLGSNARADGTWVNCERTNGYYQYFDSATVQVGKDAAVGDLLGTWLSSYNPTAWTCSHRTNYQSYIVPMAVQGYPPYTIWGTTQVDGQTYSVYNTAVKTGLGYIARWRYTVQGQTSEWYPLTSTNGVYQTPSQLFNATYSGSSWNVGVDVQIRFVKTSTSLTAGSMPVFDPMYMRTYQNYSGTSSVGSGTYMIADFLAGGLVISTTGGTCTTSDITVNLPPVSRSDFTGVGVTAARTDFNLNFTQCPAGMASISYLFTPTSSILDSTNGVFALSANSTASGVGIQLLNAQDIPVSFNTEYLLTDYDPALNNASYSVPLRAGLYQTSTDVSSGLVNGAVTFTLVYK